MMHKCPIAECRRRVEDTRLMCMPHWLSLPDAIRNEVVRHFDIKQVIASSGVKPSDAWHRAAFAAITRANQIDAAERKLREEQQLRDVGR